MRTFAIAKRPLGLCLAGLLTLMVSTPPALAAGLEIEEIIVTAEKREANIQDVGIAVSALDVTAIERLNARDLRDLQGIVPNLTLNEVGIGPSMSQVSIRGVNSQDPEKSFDPAVGTFLDGVYLASSAFNLLDTFDLERVEVLRGPQGTLFGRNTTGGAINAIRSKPTGEFGIKAGAVLGDEGRQDLKAVVNFGLAENLGLKVAAYREADDGYWDNSTGGGPQGERDSWSASASLLWEGESGDIQLTYDRAEDEGELPPYIARGVAVPSPIPVRITEASFPTPATVVSAFRPDIWCSVAGLAECSQSDSASNGPHFQDSELDALTLNASFDVGDQHTFNIISGWRDHEEAVYIDFDGTASTVFDVVRFQQAEQTSLELQLASDRPGNFNYIVGAFWMEHEYDLQQAIKLDLANVGAPVPPGLLYVNGNGDEDSHESKSYAVFAQVDIDLTERATLTLGVRGTWDEREITTTFYGSTLAPTDPYTILNGIPANRPVSAAGAGSNDDDWFEITPKVALNFQLNEQILLYGSYTRGYNAGGFSARAGTVATVTESFDPEFINAYEVGMKSDLADGRIRFNAAVFYNDYDDKQEEAIEPAPPPTFTSTTVRNVAGARIMGVELEMSALINENFRIDANLGYMDAEYTDFDGFLSDAQYVSVPAQPANTLLAADLSSLELRRAPELTASVIPQVFLPIGTGELEANAVVRYVDEQYTEIFNNERGLIDSQVLVDATIAYRFGGEEGDRYTLKLFGRNLTDEDDFASFTNSIVDFSTVQLPRRYGLEFQVQL